jgi:heptosyltransferase III
MKTPIDPNGGRKMKILVFLFGSLGDSIVAIPALRAVRRHFPDAEIVMLQNFESGNLVTASEVIPASLIDRHLSYKSTAAGTGKLSNFVDLMRRIRREKFDAAVYAVMSERPARAVARDRYFFRACGIRSLYGFRAIPPAELWPVDPNGHPEKSAHEAEFRLQRLSLDGIDAMPETDLSTPLFEFRAEELEKADSWLRTKRRQPHLPLFSIAPGCKTLSNLWPFENFVLLGKLLLESYDCELMVTGGPAERELGNRLIEALGSGINAAGEFGVKDSAAVLYRSDIHIGLDTGTMHLAAAAGTRCFALFGERNNPGLWYPLGSGHAIVYHRVPCAGCHTHECPVPGHPCMTSISVESAWRHLRAFLDDSTERCGVELIAV